jgi:hypothetical protein
MPAPAPRLGPTLALVVLWVALYLLWVAVKPSEPAPPDRTTATTTTTTKVGALSPSGLSGQPGSA